MSFAALSPRPSVERFVEHVRRSVRTFRSRDQNTERHELVARLPRTAAINNLIDRNTGYGILAPGALDGVQDVAAFCRSFRDKQDFKIARKKSDYNPTILEVKRYEDAPEVVDFVLSDNVLQIASDYLGEIPVLMGIKLWCSPPNEHLGKLKGSQMYHRDGQTWTLRRAKFLINMDDVDEDCGPFTFLPADVSDRVGKSLGSITGQNRVTDEEVFRIAKPTDPIRLIGPAGTGAAVDSSRCFHCGARVRKGERLLLQFHFLRHVDALHGGSVVRTDAFAKRFGSDRVRELIVPRDAHSGSAAFIDED